MASWKLGDLERRVMEHLWAAPEPQTVRQVHSAVSAPRGLAYTTVMTVLRRLSDKGLVAQDRDDRAHRYAPIYGRDELVAGLMVDALDQMADTGNRSAALVHFVGSVRTEDLHALQRALDNLESQSNLAQSRVAGSGIVAVTTVPAPGRERILSVPPTSSARSDIDSNP